MKSLVATFDGTAATNGQKIDLLHLALGDHTLSVTATDYYGNATTQNVKFSVIATVQSLKTTVNRLYADGGIKASGIRDSLLTKLDAAQAYLDQGNTKAAINQLNAFINSVKSQTGKQITKAAADLLITDANFVIKNPK